MGGWSDQGDQIQTILFAYGIELFFFLKRYIWKDQSIHSHFCCFLYEVLCSIGKNNIGIGHEHHRDGCFLTDLCYHVKNLICGYAAA